MKKLTLIAALLFLSFVSQACNLAGPNQFVVTHHQTFNYTWYSETEWYGYLVNPCGENVGSYTLVTSTAGIQ